MECVRSKAVQRKMRLGGCLRSTCPTFRDARPSRSVRDKITPAQDSVAQLRSQTSVVEGQSRFFCLAVLEHGYLGNVVPQAKRKAELKMRGLD